MKSEHLPSNAADGALRGGCEKEEKNKPNQEKGNEMSTGTSHDEVMREWDEEIA